MIRTAEAPAETWIPSGIVPSVLIFQIWTANVSACRKMLIGLETLSGFQFESLTLAHSLTCGGEINAAASPKIRPELRITPVNIPGVASGTMIRMTVFPSATIQVTTQLHAVYSGWLCNDSSTFLVSNGKLKNVSARAPEIIENP